MLLNKLSSFRHLLAELAGELVHQLGVRCPELNRVRLAHAVDPGSIGEFEGRAPARGYLGALWRALRGRGG